MPRAQQAAVTTTDDWRLVRREATDAEARALASTLRMRILRVCLHEAHSNKEIAEILGRDPATTLHHVRRLVDTGFLAAEPVRRGTRGSREIPYRATGKSWRLKGGPAKDRVLIDAYLEEVALVPVQSVETARLGLQMTEELKAEFDERLIALLEEFRQRADTARTGQAWSVFYSIHPDPNYAATRRVAGGRRPRQQRG
ncbi:MAG TPA: winged helix-turn-helix domain-containing protein [Jatrophihabitans sp.]|jgi:predicted ArsR family transcriptional regulator|nr:winged helix-turn-helix domain-containing protein [Jatrophihabitans sp.]